MTESPTPVGEREATQKSTFLLVYSPEDSHEFGTKVISELRDQGFKVTDINDRILNKTWDEDGMEIMENTPAVLIIPSKAMKKDGPIKDVLYQAITLKVEKKKKVVPIFNQENENASVSSLSTLAGINWDGKTYGFGNIDKDRAFVHLKSFLADATSY